MCSRCEQVVPTVQCLRCDANWCDPCFAHTHKEGARSQHPHQRIPERTQSQARAAQAPVESKAKEAGSFALAAVSDVFFPERFEMKQQPCLAALPRLDKWLTDAPPLTAARTRKVVLDFTSTFVTSFCGRAQRDVSFFLACSLFDPLHRAEFAANPTIVTLHLARIRQEFPDLITREVFHSAHMYFAKGTLGIALPDPPFHAAKKTKKDEKEQKGEAEESKESKKRKKRKKRKKKTAKKMEERTLSVYYLDVKEHHPSDCGLFATLALYITSIIPTSVICEQRFSLVNEALTNKRTALGLDKVITYGYMRDLGKYKSMIEFDWVMREFGHLLGSLS